jgi:hypothetical protein
MSRANLHSSLTPTSEPPRNGDFHTGRDETDPRRVRISGTDADHLALFSHTIASGLAQGDIGPTSLTLVGRCLSWKLATCANVYVEVGHVIAVERWKGEHAEECREGSRKMAQLLQLCHTTYRGISKS